MISRLTWLITYWGLDGLSNTVDAAIRIDLTLCRGCALYPHYGALTSWSHSGGPALLQRNLSDPWLFHHTASNHTPSWSQALGGLVSPWHLPPSWPNYCPKRGRRQNNSTGLTGLSPSTWSGQHACITLPLWRYRWKSTQPDQVKAVPYRRMWLHEKARTGDSWSTD
jgi:hypothetical protein